MTKGHNPGQVTFFSVTKMQWTVRMRLCQIIDYLEGNIDNTSNLYLTIK